VFLLLSYASHRGGSRGEGGGAPPKSRKNMIFWRKIVIFHTKYPKHFRTSLRSEQFFLSASPLIWNPGCAPVRSGIRYACVQKNFAGSVYTQCIFQKLFRRISTPSWKVFCLFRTDDEKWHWELDFWTQVDERWNINSIRGNSGILLSMCGKFMRVMANWTSFCCYNLVERLRICKESSHRYLEKTFSKDINT
jgi:hypothetical protein